MLRFVLCLSLLLSFISPAFTQTPKKADTHRFQFISAAKNIGHADTKFGSADLTPDCPTPWSVEFKTLHGGKQDGVKLLTLDNGKMQIVLIPTRGMGILSVAMGDLK